ncbi:hypothetical protein PMZ80_010017 [Knufia obscura]|uniref:Uncharacterized protein n=1 Tax=Knufia obscura TaxID=1635080 RepID=A0ABR0RBA5_9EURO|nr:hypothetical protein PMZ80_010017 [Knufia obscura]
MSSRSAAMREVMLDDTLMLKGAMKCVHGTLDFDKLAVKLNISNGEAMRKRFRRFFERDGEPIKVVGCTLGEGKGQKFIATTANRSRKKALSIDLQPQATVAEGPASTANEDVDSDDASDYEQSIVYSGKPRSKRPPRAAVLADEGQETISTSPAHNASAEPLVKPRPAHANIKRRAQKKPHRVATTPAQQPLTDASTTDQVEEDDDHDPETPFYRALHAKFGSHMQAKKRDRRAEKDQEIVPADLATSEAKRAKVDIEQELADEDAEIEVFDLS